MAKVTKEIRTIDSHRTAFFLMQSNLLESLVFSSTMNTKMPEDQRDQPQVLTVRAFRAVLLPNP